MWALNNVPVGGRLPASAAATAAAAAATTAAAATLAFLSDIDANCSSVDLLTVQTRNRGSRLVLLRHCHETKATAPTGLTIRDDLGLFDRTECLEGCCE